MVIHQETITDYGLTREMTRGINNRIRALVLFSSTTIALAFGLSFYFSLISSGTAIARQFPEFSSMLSNLKSALVMNTFGFAAVIIASFYILTLLITNRLFRPLGVIQKGLMDMTANHLPNISEETGSGPFSNLELAFKSIVTAQSERDRMELEKLTGWKNAWGKGPDGEKVRAEIEEMIKERQIRLGLIKENENRASAEKGSAENDPLFMQPA